MIPFAFYLLKVTLCSGILLGYYWLLLRNKVFHHYNRFYLLAAIVLSLALPLMEINIWHSAGTPAPQAIKILQVVNSNEYLDEIVITARRNNFTTEQALLLFYSITSVVFFVLFAGMLKRIRNLFLKNQHSRVEGIYFVNTTAKGTPFSFLKYIFWNDHIDPESATGRQIFKHELAHVQQKHSYDKLFINAVLIFFWCNPFFWLIRKELNMIHEFMADKIAVEDSDTEAFAAMILQATFPQHRFLLTNPFFYSPIKRRLLMLTKNKNPKAGYFGRVLVLPLAAFVFAAFTLKAKTLKPVHPSLYDGKKITVVIDAGHGGDDKGAQSLAGNIAEKDLTLAIIKKIKALNTNASINVVLTRETDIYQSVQEKADFTKAQNADLFISIHIDGTTTEQASLKSGMSVWVAKDNYFNSNSSKLFASAIIKEFTDHYNLPVISLPQQRQIGIKVLQESPCPSVLIEAGYITNSKDIAWLQTDAAQQLFATNILSAIEKYAIAKEKGEPVTSVAATAANENFPGKNRDTVPAATLNNYEKALIIVDGKTVSQKDLRAIQPQRIESVNVIKGADAIAQYGEKGKNGVVIVTTKVKEIVLKDVVVILHDQDSTTKVTVDNAQIQVKDEKLAVTKALFVIDSKVQSNGLMSNSIAPDEIERIDVLKGKAAMDKYGEQGINGVIEITTKTSAGTKETTRSDAIKGGNVKAVKINGTAGNRKKQPHQDQRIFTKAEYEPAFPGGDSAW